MRNLVLVGLFVGALLGCSETHNHYFLGCGEGGTLHSGDFGVACSYVVVVTGFECPDSVPYHTEFEGGHVCSAEPIDPMQLPKEICNAFKGKCAPVSPSDGGTPVDASVGCEVTADCAEGQYCKGDCSALGTCVDIPQDATCTEAEVDYCLCDGTPAHHNNGCVWERYTPGDYACYDGCPLDDPFCTQCEKTADCAEGYYCEGDCSGPGKCSPIPDVACGEAETPYCTCDGQAVINSNTCVWERHTPGDNSCTNTAGECQQTEDCADGYYCEGDCSGPGTCTMIPDEACPPSAPYYCSCDGESRQSFSACIYDRHDPGTVGVEECMAL